MKEQKSFIPKSSQLTQFKTESNKERSLKNTLSPTQSSSQSRSSKLYGNQFPLSQLDNQDNLQMNKELQQKEISHNKNIETFRNRSNKYSRESVQFLHEKRALLNQESSNLQRHPAGKQPFDLLAEVNRIYEIRTSFNKFEQENHSHSKHQSSTMETSPFLTQHDSSQRYTSLQPFFSDDVDEVKETDVNSISSRMKTLQSGQRQVFSIQKVENQNSSTTSETYNQTQKQTTNNSFQETKQNNIIHYQQVNSYVLNPSQARTSLQSVNSQPSLHSKRFSSPPTSLNKQISPAANDMFRPVAPIKQDLNQIPVIASGISLAKRVLPEQNFLTNPQVSTPFLEVSFHPNDLRKSQDSFQTQNFATRDSNKDLNSGLSNTAYFGNGGIQQTPQNLGYAVNLVNKGISDLSQHLSLLNPLTLQILDLSSNQISPFPVEILCLKNLKVLKLESNLIRTIPQELFAELQLESFSISNNLIIEIPDEIINWKICLQRLNLSKNHIKSFSKELCTLQNMTSLNVSSNDFTEIPFEMTALSQLKEFSIDWFKYCLPPKRTTVQGQEGNLIILEMFSLLRENRSQGYVTFLQFTTKFSDKELIKASKTIKRRNVPNAAKPIYQHPQVEGHNNKVDSQNPKQEAPFKNQFRQDMKQFTLNISNGNLANSTFTSINESCLPKETDGIQFLPPIPKINGHLFFHGEELQSPLNGVKNSIIDSITHNTEFSGILLPHKSIDHAGKQEDKKQQINIFNSNQNNLKMQEQSLNEAKVNLITSENRQHSVLLGSQQYQQQQQKSTIINGTKNIPGNNGVPQQIGSSATIPLMNFSSQTALSIGDEALKSHNDLSFFQDENYQTSHFSAKIMSPQSGSQFFKNTNKSQVGLKRNEIQVEKRQDCDNEMAQNMLLLQKLNLDIVESPQTLFQQQDCDIQQINNNFSKDIEEHKQNITANTTNSPPIYSQYYLIDPKNGRNLLHLAVMDEDISALRCLITLNPDLINQVDFDGHTPLSLSIFEEKYFSAKILVFNQADTNCGGGGFGSCLTIGVIKLQYFLIRDLIRFGANVNKVDAEGNSPLHYLFQQFIKEPEESVKIAQLLLDNGADPNLENNAKWCPLHFGIRCGSLEALQFALNYNSVCFSKKIKRGFLLNKPGGPEGLTLLHLASELNCPKIVSLLLSNHVDIFSRQFNDKTPSQLCQRHILVKKLILLKQSQILEEFIEDQLEINDNDDKQQQEVTQTNKQLTRSYSFEKYNKKKLEKNTQKKGFLSSLREDTREDDFNRLSEEEIDDQNENNDQSESCEIEDDSQNENNNKRNLNDSADSFPVDEEDEDHNQQSQSQSMSTLARNNLNQIHISSQPRMIKNEPQTLSVSGIQRLKDREEVLTRQETEFNEMNESKMSLEEIEDEDCKGDAPKWFYKDHSQIPYSPNNLQKIEGMNEIISQIISQSSNHNVSAPNLLRYKPQSVLLTKPFPEQGKINHFQSKIFNPKIGYTPSYPGQKLIKPQTMQTCNFFTNLKNYKQVLKSASNIGEFQLKILEENLALSTRLHFLVQLRLIQFKLIQVLRLITRQNIYQLFCRSGIIEDFLKLGDDNLNTLINTSKDFGNCIITIYNKLFESPSFDNNTLLVQLINLFGDSSINLFNQVESNLLKQKQSLFLNGSKKNDETATKTEEKKVNFFGIMILTDQKINYDSNILKEYLEIEQCQKIIKDSFTQKTLITDLDFDRIMPPTEDEYEPQSEQLSKTLSNYAHIKKSSNPLQSISYESKFFK